MQHQLHATHRRGGDSGGHNRGEWSESTIWSMTIIILAKPEQLSADRHVCSFAPVDLWLQNVMQTPKRIRKKRAYLNSNLLVNKYRRNSVRSYVHIFQSAARQTRRPLKSLKLISNLKNCQALSIGGACLPCP